MKKIFLILLPAIIIITGTACSQKWFTINEVAQGTWVISDNGNDNIYLIQGTDSAMLIDTGLGSADISSLASSLTDKPIIVINTHAHPDHSGGNHQFPEVYIYPEDTEAARSYNPSPGINSGRNSRPAENETNKGKPFNTRYVPLIDGQKFDLGGRRLEVIHAPGHTPGEICVLDIDNKLLFTGDNTNALVWLFLDNSKPLHEYLVTLEKLERRESEYISIMPGHGTPLPGDFIKDQISCVKGILSNTLEAKPYESFAGTAKVSVYGGASVVFNPDNL